jgi:fumarate hydratase class II
MARSPMPMTALALKTGYGNTTKIVKSALGHGMTLQEAAVPPAFFISCGFRTLGAAG